MNMRLNICKLAFKKKKSRAINEKHKKVETLPSFESKSDLCKPWCCRISLFLRQHITSNLCQYSLQKSFESIHSQTCSTRRKMHAIWYLDQALFIENLYRENFLIQFSNLRHSNSHPRSHSHFYSRLCSRPRLRSRSQPTRHFWLIWIIWIFWLDVWNLKKANLAAVSFAKMRWQKCVKKHHWKKKTCWKINFDEKFD